MNDVLCFNLLMNNGCNLQCQTCYSFIGINKSGYAKQTAAKISYNYDCNIGYLFTIYLAKDRLACRSRRLAIITYPENISIGSNPVSKAMMNGFGMFFL